MKSPYAYSKHRFIASLTSAKVYSTPPSIDRLSEIFQDFYVQAENSIHTHIQTLSSRLHREVSPAPSVSSRTSTNSRRNPALRLKPSRDALDSSERNGTVQQMLTPGEISDRRKERRLLESKRVALEEAVERRVCEGVYSRIWRHRGTLDEIKDEKLRSRTAALALVGIGLKDLGIDLDALDDGENSAERRSALVEEWIAKAREGLMMMNESHYPLGKLQYLASAHQNIVDLLTDLHQSSSSADEILPTLIYTLITSPPEGINVISNLNFIQRFRCSTKVDGEAAYCLTNLEAAITFLETVDLASLRSDEPLEGPPKSSSRPATPGVDSFFRSSHSQLANASDGQSKTPVTSIPLASIENVPHPLSSPLTEGHSSPLPSPTNQRRLSTLFQQPAGGLIAATDAVRSTADHSIKSIGNTLDNSFKLLFGRLKEQHAHGEGVDAQGAVIVPRTLDDARKLMSPKTSFDEDGNVSAASSVSGQPEEDLSSSPHRDDRLIDLIGGRKLMRDRSVDSAVSTGSNSRRVAFASDPNALREKSGSPAVSQPVNPLAGPPTPTLASNAAVESMRSFGNSINPLNRLAGINVMRGFGRTTSTTPPPSLPLDPPPPPTTSVTNADKAGQKIEPPVQKYLDAADASELRIGDVTGLLKDYKRLAEALKGASMY